MFWILATALPHLTAADATKENAPRKFVFSLLPKSLQKRPTLDFSVITEMTAAGRKYPHPTPAKPMYFVGQPGEYTQMGSSRTANENPPPAAELQRAMEKALASAGYLPAADGTPAARLAVVFNFGSFARFSTEVEDAAEEEAWQKLVDTTPSEALPVPPPWPPTAGGRTAAQLLYHILGDVEKRKDVLARAALVGGGKFAREMAEMIVAEASYQRSRIKSDATDDSLVKVSHDDSASPFYVFCNRNEKVMYLVEESFSSCYFVIASAYDYAALAKGQKNLLWRTKMTVNSLGVSMAETLPPLIASAGPYLGRDMEEPAIVPGKISREGRVEVGIPTVVRDKDPSAPVLPAEKK